MVLRAGFQVQSKIGPSSRIAKYLNFDKKLEISGEKLEIKNWEFKRFLEDQFESNSLETV